MSLSPSAQNDELVCAFRNTLYRVYIEHRVFDIYIGQLSPEFDAALATYQIDCWSIITPDNPGAVQCSAEQNIEARSRFLADVINSGYPAYRAQHIALQHTWPVENGFLIGNISLLHSQGLARQYGQIAIVAGQQHKEPELFWCNSVDQ